MALSAAAFVLDTASDAIGRMDETPAIAPDGLVTEGVLGWFGAFMISFGLPKFYQIIPFRSISRISAFLGMANMLTKHVMKL